MRVVTSPLRPFALPLLAALSTSCAYDWSLGARASEAGPDSTIAVDSAPADTTATDTATAVDTAPDCKALTDALELARAASRVCDAKPTSCSTTVKDECDCESPIGESTKPASAAFVQAVAEYKAGGCTGTCGTACPAPTVHNCIVSDAGGYACTL
jgi:hypothetical protein